MDEGFFLGISTEQLKRKILLAVTFSLFVLQMVFSCQVNASPTNTTNGGSKGAAYTVAISASIVPVTGVKLNKITTSVVVGANETLTATVAPTNATNKKVTWKSSNKAVATVDSKGKVVGVKAGVAVITVTTADGSKTATCTVKVSVVPVTGVSINKSSLTMKIRSSETLKATLIPSNATNINVYWDSSNTAIATVGLLTGKVVGLKVGTAKITVYTEDGNMTGVCNVNVINPDIVTFEDINLEKAVRKSIEKSTGDLLKSDVKKIITLDAGSDAIYDISGIGNLINLQRLNLDSNQISDISELNELTKLTSLHLSNNKINNIDTLETLTKLTNLDLSSNKISDISELKGLTKLTSLHLSNNKINDIIVLKKLTNLTNIYLDQNKISNINPLKVSNKLKYLNLSQNLIGEADKKSLRNALPKCKIIF